VPLLCRSPSCRLFSPQPPSPLRRRVVPRSREADAPHTTRPRHGPRKPGHARVRAHQHREAKPCSRLAVPLLDRIEPRRDTPQPRHGLAVRGDHATPPRRRVRVAAKPLGHFLEHLLGITTHTHPSTHAHGATLARAAPDLAATPDLVGDRQAGLACRGKRGALPPGPMLSKREREREGSEPWAGLLGRASLRAQPAQGSSQPAEPQDELTRGAKPSLLGARAGPTPFHFLLSGLTEGPTHQPRGEADSWDPLTPLDR
jgi:hypothetical protein